MPGTLLLNPSLPASAKLIWMVSRLSQQAGTTWLCQTSGLSRPTVLAGLARLRASGWDRARPSAAGATVPVPTALLTDRRLSAQARVLYGVLLLTPWFRHPSGQFTYPTLAALAQTGPNTVARAAGALARAEDQAGAVKPPSADALRTHLPWLRAGHDPARCGTVAPGEDPVLRRGDDA